MSDIDDRFEAFLAHAGGEMVGWSFSSMTTAGRMGTDQLPWSYGSLVIPLMANATDMLDMGTGGGEILSNLRPLPANTYATEGWAPNVPVARERLEPLGVTVYGIADDTDPLPFADRSLDLVLNRHDAYDARELKRVLRPGGTFITQQIGGQNDADLNELLGTPPAEDYSDWTLDHAMSELSDAGLLVVEGREDFPSTRFYDIGALIFYLKAVPWQIDDFSIEKHRAQLYDVHLMIEQQGWLEVGGHRFIVRAEAPIE
jgi:SAM-dependent methyltransferase